MGDEIREPPLTEVMSTEPFVLDRPFQRLRRARVAVALFIVALIVAPAASAYIGYELGIRRTNQQIAALNKSRATNRAQLQKEQAATLQLVCDVLQALPPSPQINRDRSHFHCGPSLPAPEPSARVTPAPTHTPPPGTARSGVAPTTAPTRTPTPTPTPTKAPTPSPAPTPTPGPTPGPTPICVLGIICI